MKYLSTLRLAASLALLVPLALLPAVAFASTPNSTPDFPENSASAITVSIECQIKEVREGQRVLLFDPATGSENEVQLASSLRVRARSKKDFDGRRKLTIDDLSAGQAIKLTVLRASGEIQQIEVLASKNWPSVGQVAAPAPGTR